jgi:hypothetical protein
MTDENERMRSSAHGDLPDALRWQLRAMRQDAPPARDLWGQIAPRLEARPAARAPVRTPWLALAASVLLVVGVAGIWRGHLREGDAGQAALVEARRMSTDYREALDSLPASAKESPSLAPALDELDESAAQIRRALARDPDSRLLLEQLRRTYARRLELSQRAIVG